MMHFQLGDPQLEFPCGHSILLPRQSPLGIFQGLESHPTGEWPAIFLCSFCGQFFVCSHEDVVGDSQTTVHRSLSEANGTQSWVNIWNGSGKKAASKGLVATHGFFILTTTH